MSTHGVFFAGIINRIIEGFVYMNASRGKYVLSRIGHPCHTVMTHHTHTYPRTHTRTYSTHTREPTVGAQVITDCPRLTTTTQDPLVSHSAVAHRSHLASSLATATWAVLLHDDGLSSAMRGGKESGIFRSSCGYRDEMTCGCSLACVRHKMKKNRKRRLLGARISHRLSFRSTTSKR